jgi:glutamyl-tRNA reductase
MVMGAGLMAAETVQELVARRMDFVVCARRVERAALLARRADQVVPFDQLPLMLERAEVVVCATGARAPLLCVADVELAMSRRDGRPLVIVDLSLPRNVDPAAGRVPGVRLLDLEDLVSGSSLAELRRRTEIVDDEFRRFASWLAGQLAGHLIARLHSGVREVCREALELSFNHAGLDSAAIAAASHTLAGRILHEPTLTIKSLVAQGDQAAALAVLASFGISADADQPRSAPNARSVRLVARSGRGFGERGRAASAVSIAS